MIRGVLRSQLSGVARRPARLLLTGLAVLAASFMLYATVLAQQITQRTALDNLSGTPAAVDLVVRMPDKSSNVDVLAAKLSRIDGVPGVAEAVGRIDAAGQVGTQVLSLIGDPGSGPLSVAHVTEGRYPSAPNEVAVTPRTAARMGLPIGTRFTLQIYDQNDKPMSSDLVVTGVVGYAGDPGFVAFTPPRALSAVPGAKVERVDVRLAAGASEESVRAGIEAAFTGTERPEVRNGAKVRLQEAKARTSHLTTLFAVVAVFVAIAVVAAGLVAASTFRIVFAQRMRQLALLRTVGAGRASITGALATEGALTGFVAGVVGVLGALVVGHLAPPALNLFGITVAGPGNPLAAAVGTIALAVVTTVLAVLSPAASAARVAPLEALRVASTTAGRRGIGRMRGAFGVLLAAGAGLVAASVVLSLPGPDPQDYNAQSKLLAIVVSGALAFSALIALGPVLVRPVLAAVGWPLRRLGPVGRLAVGGIGGAPRRAAAVSVVVALGVTLIAGVLVAGASAQVLTERELATKNPADFEVVSDDSPTIKPEVVQRASASPELIHVTPYRRLSDVKVGSTIRPFDATDLRFASLPTLAKVDTAQGALTKLGPGAMALSTSAHNATGLNTGDQVMIESNKHTVRLTVAAVLAGDTPLGSGIIIDPSDMDRLGVPAEAAGLLADAAKRGEDGRTAAHKALHRIADAGTKLEVTVLADIRDQKIRALDGVLGVAIGLIGLTVLIAVVGVGTTTALSVVERTRETGLLRAVGLSRGALRAMLTAEAGLYGVIGATIGLILGVPYAWLAVKALGLNAPLELPVPDLAVVFLTLVVLTALAGVLPARRAAKVSPVAALGTDG